MMAVYIGAGTLRNVAIEGGSVVIDVEEMARIKTRIVINKETWDTICDLVADEMAKGVTPGEKV